jgi:pimeloyl-ACP methyl ester carboxylesterase
MPPAMRRCRPAGHAQAVRGVILPGCGHFVMEEAPALFNEHLLAFLQGPAASG